MKKCIIFGAGFTGRNAYSKLSLIYQVMAYSDNDSSMWGKSINGVTVLEPRELKECQLKNECDIVICSDYFPEIQKQLLEMGINTIRIIEPSGYMLYEYMPYNMLQPVNGLLRYRCYKKNSDAMHILFVQQHPCIRTHKIAEILTAKGIDVSIAYTAETPEARHPRYAKLYKNKLAFLSIQDLLDYVNGSDYDLVHCSNEPDSLTNIMLSTNKPVVHDTHDFMSLNYKAGRDLMTMEYLANTRSHGLMYVNEYNLQLAVKRYSIDVRKAVIIENRPSDMSIHEKKLPKLSAFDHELHCVYEGGIHKNPNYFRFVEDIWLKIAKSGVHVHFYTQTDPAYCRSIEQKHQNLHYEGEVDSAELLTELTKYDCGLLLFNEVMENWLKLDTSLPNKIYEYLAAGLPEVIGSFKSHKEFVEKYSVGRSLDFNKDIKKQISEIKEIQIPSDFIVKNNLTMSSQADKLINFYEKIISNHSKNL